MRSLLLAALLALLSAAPAAALPGQLDPSFDGDGTKVLDKLGLEGAQSVLIQPDGKLVVAANAANGGGGFAIARLHPDGGVDTGFDDDGVAYVGFGFGTFARAAALQPDGKLVVAGAADGDVAVTRLHANGSLDNGFDPGGPDGDGKKIIDFLGEEEGRDVVVQPDGKIVIVGSAGANAALAVTRLNPDGSFDTTFDGDGVAGVELGGDENGLAVALQPDGKILAGGHTTLDFNVLVARFNRTGPSDATLDPTFGTWGGWRTIGYGGDDIATDVLVQPDGKVLIAGVGGSNTALTVTRLKPDGSFDRSFDLDGTSGADFGGSETGTAAVLQPDGKVVLVGSTSLNNDIAVARLQPSGALDSSYSADGKTTINLGASEYGYASALQPDGRIVIAGDTINGPTEGAVIARLQGDRAPAPGGGPGPGAPGPGGGGAGTDRPPRISRLSLSSTRFRARLGTRIRFTLSEPARVIVTIERAAAGRRVRGACRPARPSNRRAPRCTRWRRAGRLRLSGRHGANRKRFVGRSLTAGRHRLRLLAVDAAGQRSRPRVAHFTVLRAAGARVGFMTVP